MTMAAMTTKQEELVAKAKAILRILNPLTRADREAVANIVLQLLTAEERERIDNVDQALAQEKAAYANREGAWEKETRPIVDTHGLVGVRG